MFLKNILSTDLIEYDYRNKKKKVVRVITWRNRWNHIKIKT